MAAAQHTQLASNALVLVTGLGGYLVTLSITFEVAPIIKNNPSELRVKLWAIFRREKLNLLYGLFFTVVTVVHPEHGGTKSGAQSCSVYQYPLPRASQFIRECETIMWFPMLAAVVSYLVTLEQTIRLSEGTDELLITAMKNSCAPWRSCLWSILMPSPVKS